MNLQIADGNDVLMIINSSDELLLPTKVGERTKAFGILCRALAHLADVKLPDDATASVTDQCLKESAQCLDAQIGDDCSLPLKRQDSQILPFRRQPPARVQQDW